MKIAFVVGYFPAVSETFVLRQITGLIDRGHKVDIFAHRGSDGVVHPDVTKYGLLDRTIYWNLPGSVVARGLAGLKLFFERGWRDPMAAARSVDIIRYGRLSGTLILPFATLALQPHRRYDVIHAHFGPNGLLGWALNEIGVLRGPLVTSFHGYDVTSLPLKYGQRMYQALFRGGRLFSANSEFTRRRLLAMGCPPARLVRLPMGVDTAQYAREPRRALGFGPVRLLSIGRLVEVKGIEYGIRAVAKTMETCRNLHYRIVGDGPLRGKLEELVRRLRLVGHVQFLGRQPQHKVCELLSESHVFMLPSIRATDGSEEAQGLVLLEAQAAGLPVIASRSGGISESVIDGHTGFLVPPRDVDALAERLRWLAERPECWADIGRNGRAFVERFFEIRNLNEELEQLYLRAAEACPENSNNP